MLEKYTSPKVKQINPADQKSISSNQTPTKLETALNYGDITGVVTLSPTWYKGGISRTEAEILLSKSGINHFLVRTSSVQGRYALSIYRVADFVQSILLSFLYYYTYIIASAVEGYSLQDCAVDQQVYKSIQQLVETSPLLNNFMPIGNI